MLALKPARSPRTLNAAVAAFYRRPLQGPVAQRFASAITCLVCARAGGRYLPSRSPQSAKRSGACNEKT